MKKNLIRLLVIAFAVALLSTFLFYRLLVGQLASGSGDTQSIVVAARKLEAGAILTPADVKMRAIASSASVKGAFSAGEQAVGLTVLGPIEYAMVLQYQVVLIQAADVMRGLLQAMVATAAGLLVAIPCYVAFNLLVIKIDRIVLDMERAASEIQAFLHNIEAPVSKGA